MGLALGNTAIAVLLMLLATSLVNVGGVVQKGAVDALPPLESTPFLRSLRALVGSPLWVLGYALALVGLVLNMVAVGLADMSVVQPLNGFGLVVLVLFSRLYLGERLTPLMVVGMGAIIIGVGLTGATVPESRTFADVDGLLACYTHGRAGAALASVLAVILALWVAARNAGRYGGVLYAFIAACSSVLGLTFAKGLFGLLALGGFARATRLGPSYVLLALTLTFSGMALWLQQLSFQKERAVVVTPVFAATSVVLPLVVGFLVFQEALARTTVLAALVIVVGVVCLGSQRAEGDGAEEPAGAVPSTPRNQA